MDPKIWGPHLWFFLHSITFSYAEDKENPTRQEKKHMYNFLNSLKYTLPCICKNNYREHFNKNPPNLKSRRKLFEWMVDLHNTVNEESNKETYIKYGLTKPHLFKRQYTYKEVETMYKNFYNK